MPIDLRCPCGRNATVANEHAGKRAKCPACGRIMIVPAPSPRSPISPPSLFELVDPAEPADDLAASLKRATPPITPAPMAAPPVPAATEPVKLDQWEKPV